MDRRLSRRSLRINREGYWINYDEICRVVNEKIKQQLSVKRLEIKCKDHQLLIVIKLNVLHQEKKNDEKHFTSFLKASTDSKEVEIVFLDPGMVTILNKNDRAAFLKLVMYVTLRKPDECGHLML